MDSVRIRGHVNRLFSGNPFETTRVGVEHELLAFDRSGSVVTIDRIRAAARHATYLPHLGFEPGGQVEISLPPGPDAATLAKDLSSVVKTLRADCEAVGVRLVAQPVDHRPAGSVPLQLTSPRYLAMQRHFDRLGPAGRRMMRRTASTQICLDWWSGPQGLEQWRMVNLAGPFLAAVFARSAGSGSRLATWLEVDPARTAFDGRLISGDNPAAAYTAFAAGAVRFTEADDIPQHLTTLFPPVRPRGTYLEVRFLDVQRLSTMQRVISVFSGLMYDTENRESAIRLLAGEVDRLDDHWRSAAQGDEATRAVGRHLVTLALKSHPVGVVA